MEIPKNPKTQYCDRIENQLVKSYISINPTPKEKQKRYSMLLEYRLLCFTLLMFGWLDFF